MRVAATEAVTQRQARELRARVAAEVGLSVSLGLGGNKLVARTATRIDWARNQNDIYAFRYLFDQQSFNNQFPTAFAGFEINVPSRIQNFYLSNTHIFSPRLKRNPCEKTRRGTSTPADIRNAGQ